ncbi:unnamed protein product [Linum tenue]|uniref:Uncharacterized protein n=1 Tax=Linum tenue TaxID=586396 RepID=A0AAV0IQ32_9ROSI|nr:unnamed protein product [Linum tenue]
MREVIMFVRITKLFGSLAANGVLNCPLPVKYMEGN